YDFIVASLVIGGRRQTRRPELQPSRVRLPYERGGGADALRRIVSCPLELGADALELEFPTDALDLPLAHANAPLGQVLQDAARELIVNAERPSELLTAVRERIRQGLADNDVDARAVARSLHLSERTLRRRLDAERIGLREL